MTGARRPGGRPALVPAALVPAALVPAAPVLAALAVAALALGAVAPRVASAELPPRGTAAVRDGGSLELGVLAPLGLGVGHGVELRTHPLLFPVAPNVVVRIAHGRAGAWRLAGEYGASAPGGAMRLLQGYLFPTYARGGGELGWWIVPRAGVVATRATARGHALTLRGDLAVGVALSEQDVEPLDAPAVLDLLFAPVASGFRGRGGALVDARLSRRWRAQALVDVYVHGATPSPVTLRAGAGADLAIGRRLRLALGLMWWNHDQRARNAEGRGVRSNDVLPTVDLIYAR